MLLRICRVTPGWVCLSDDALEPTPTSCTYRAWRRDRLVTKIHGVCVVAVLCQPARVEFGLQQKDRTNPGDSGVVGIRLRTLRFELPHSNTQTHVPLPL